MKNSLILNRAAAQAGTGAGPNNNNNKKKPHEDIEAMSTSETTNGGTNESDDRPMPLQDHSNVFAAYANQNSGSSRSGHPMIDKPPRPMLLTTSSGGLGTSGKQVSFSETVLVTPFRRDTTTSAAYITANGMTVVPGVMSESEAAAKRGYAKLKGHVHRKQLTTWFVSIEWTVELVMALILVFSVIEAFSAMGQCMSAFPKNNCDDGLVVFSIALGAVSFAIVAVAFIWMMCISGRISQPDARYQLDTQIFNFIFGMLFVWWFAGALVLSVPTTGPFFGPGNGFFCSWINAVLALLLFSMESREIESTLNLIDAFDRGRPRYLLLVALFFLLTLIASAGICAVSCMAGVNQAMTIFALVWSIFCLTLSAWLFVQWKEISAKMFMAVSIVLAVIVTVGVGIVTILGPFARTDGALGFFSSWFALLFAWANVFSRDPREL